MEKDKIKCCCSVCRKREYCAGSGWYCKTCSRDRGTCPYRKDLFDKKLKHLDSEDEGE